MDALAGQVSKADWQAFLKVKEQVQQQEQEVAACTAAFVTQRSQTAAAALVPPPLHITSALLSDLPGLD